jgi:hypothetical protein
MSAVLFLCILNIWTILVSLFFLSFTRSEYEISFVKIESTRVIKRHMLGQKIDLYCVEVKEETIL